jgi:uncharacterized membrane protein YhhN
MNLKTFTIIYFVISLIEICSGTIGFHEGVLLTKPLILLSIIIFYFLQTRHKSDWQDKLMLVAFAFSMIGDSFLLFEGEIHFMLGLGSFLITHLCYISVFFSQKGQANMFTRILLPIFGITIFLFIQNQLAPAIKFPFIAYMLAIITMSILASERKTNPESYRLVLIGAVLFMVSDSLLAINQFAKPLPYSTILVMGTYVFAQYFIATGFLKREKTIL